MLSGQYPPGRQLVHKVAAIMHRMDMGPPGEPILMPRDLRLPEGPSEVRPIRAREEIILISHRCILGSRHTRKSPIMIRSQLLSPIRRSRIPV